MSRRVLFLGVGVQSTFMALSMTDKYKHEPVNELIEGSVLIFSNTGSEKPETMTYWYDVLEPELKASGIEYYMVMSKRGNLHEDYRRLNAIPFRMARSCTSNFKIIPIKKKIDELFPDLGSDGLIDTFLGITTDESQRMKPNKTRYFRNKFPLVDLGYSRGDLYKFYEGWDLEPPVKSGCFCCPFARPSELIQLSIEHPDLIDIVIDMEENARKYRPRKIGKSLKIVNTQLLNGKLTVKQIIQGAKEQTGLDDWWTDSDDDDECEGACFL